MRACVLESEGIFLPVLKTLAAQNIIIGSTPFFDSELSDLKKEFNLV